MMFESMDMEDPCIPPCVLAQWVLEGPLEEPIGTEPVTLNPMLLVHPALAQRIEAALSRKAPAAPKILRSQEKGATGRASLRVRFRNPVVEDEQQPPGQEFAYDARCAPTVPWSSWSEASYGSYSGSAWHKDASETMPVRDGWSHHSRNSGIGVAESWDSCQSWSQRWSNGWGESMAYQGWDRSDSTDSTYADWWQRQTSSWEAPISWSDPWMTSSWSDGTDSTQPDWQFESRAIGSVTRVGCESLDPRSESQVQRAWRQSHREPSPLVRRGSKVLHRQSREQDDGPNSSTFCNAAVRGDSTPSSFRYGRDDPQQHTKGVERHPTPPHQRGQAWDSYSDGANQAGSYRAPPRQAKVRPIETQVAEKWKHPEGRPFGELVIGDVVEGVVTNIAVNGAFVNFGAQKDGLLPSVAVRTKYGTLKVGDRLADIEIERLDPIKKHITLKISLSTPEAHGFPFDRVNTDSARWTPSKKIVDAESRRKGEQQDDCPIAWKWSHSIWTEGETGGTRGGKD